MLPVAVSAQNITFDQRLLDSVKTESIKYQVGYDLAVKYAEGNNLPISFPTENGGLTQIHNLINGFPHYYTTDNLNSAKTDGANKVWTGGGAGLNLSGSGIQLRIWDSGKLLTTHQELNTRASMGLSQTATYSSHSTHCAGTMIASGVDANAKGHAYQATIKGFDWTSDIEEMTTEASLGMLISNHSYSYIAGWYYNSGTSMWEWYGDMSIDDNEDYIFGNYLDKSRDVDLVTNAAPYYLPVVAASNNRNDDVPSGATYKLMYTGELLTADGSEPKPDGIYDCIPGGLQTAKNTLTIGAIEDIVNGYINPSDIIITSFSGYGACDDGRIKPDIVANGASLYSCVASGSDDYSNYSGTSMATPSTSGSLALLQQHHNNLFGHYMLASTAKALVMHTADQPSATFGPSYAFGWGLLDTEGAALFISSVVDEPIRMQELNLLNNETDNLAVKSYGLSPIKITIVWNDPAGNVPAEALDPTTKILVNDLDIRLTRLSDNTVYFPFKLNPLIPDALATNGDNNTDNSECIYISAPTAGDYNITITHKGLLSGGDQDYSLLLSGLTCSNYSTTVFATIDAPSTYTLPDGSVVSTSGIYNTIFGTMYGCDSSIITVLTVNPLVCAVPTGVFSNMITSTSAKTNWTAVTGAEKYQIYYRPVGTTTWLKKSSATTSKKLTGLISNTAYEYKVKTNCGALGSSGFSPLQTFTTLLLKVTSEIENIQLSIFPNPNNGKFTVVTNNIPDVQVFVSIVDIQGKICVSGNYSCIDGSIEIDAEFANGMYFLRLNNTISEESCLFTILK